MPLLVTTKVLGPVAASVPDSSHSLSEASTAISAGPAAPSSVDAVSLAVQLVSEIPGEQSGRGDAGLGEGSVVVHVVDLSDAVVVSGSKVGSELVDGESGDGVVGGVAGALVGRRKNASTMTR